MSAKCLHGFRDGGRRLVGAKFPHADEQSQEVFQLPRSDSFAMHSRCECVGSLDWLLFERVATLAILSAHSFPKIS